MKLLSPILSIIIVIGIGFAIFETSVIPLYNQEKETNQSMRFVEKFSFNERKEAFISRLQYWFREDNTFATESGTRMTSSGISL